MKMILKGILRCPFHRKATKDNTLLEVGPYSEKAERIEAIEKAFIRFYSEPQISALLITLPHNLLAESKGLYDLKTKIIPYQSEMVAAQLSARLYPFFLHHKGWEIPDVDNTTVYAEIARNLHIMFKETGYKVPENTTDLATIMEKELTTKFLDEFNPGIRIRKTRGEIIARITRTGLKVYSEEKDSARKDPSKNKNGFSIVTTPFYKKEFPRYSEEIKLVTTRLADIYNVPENLFMKIRTANQKLLKDHGFEIGLVQKQAMPEGLWVPGMQW